MATSDFRILLVDDEPGIRKTLSSFLRKNGHDVVTAGDALEALDTFASAPFDLVVTDISMPRMSGLDLLEHVKEINEDVDVIMVTGYLDISYAIQSMRRGAYDFFTKPFNLDKVALTVDRVRERKSMRADSERFLILKRESELQKETTLSLARAAEERDRMNIGHGRRVARYAVQLARRLCFTDARIERLEYAAKLHDIGKIGIDDAILNKPGRLSATEYEAMKRHSEIGEYILKPVSIFKEVAPIVRSHHERFDGAGYPDGIAGDDIPLDARILCICDYFDAVTSKRPYREPATLTRAFGVIESERGRFFDPALVDAFLEVQSECLQSAS